MLTRATVLQMISRVVILIAFVACSGQAAPVSSAHLEAALTAASARGTGARVTLADVVPAGWERVYVFGPYTPAAVISRCVGTSADAVARTIEERDDVNLLIFQFPAGRTESVLVSRGAGDFAQEAVRRWYAPSDAIFVVRTVPAGSWGNLMAADRMTNRCS